MTLLYAAGAAIERGVMSVLGRSIALVQRLLNALDDIATWTLLVERLLASCR